MCSANKAADLCQVHQSSRLCQVDCVDCVIAGLGDVKGVFPVVGKTEILVLQHLQVLGSCMQGRVQSQVVCMKNHAQRNIFR